MIINDPVTGVEEIPTFTCAHCQSIVEVPTTGFVRGILTVNNFHQVGGVCHCCGKRVCLRCSLSRDADPKIARIERMEEEAATATLRAYGEGA